MLFHHFQIFKKITFKKTFFLKAWAVFRLFSFKSLSFLKRDGVVYIALELLSAVCEKRSSSVRLQRRISIRT